MVGINTLLASVAPLLALVFLNISTVKALKRMDRSGPGTPVKKDKTKTKKKTIGVVGKLRLWVMVRKLNHVL